MYQVAGHGTTATTVGFSSNEGPGYSAGCNEPDNPNDLDDINGTLPAHGTYFISDVGHSGVPHLAQAQRQWLEKIEGMPMYRHIIGDLRFYDPSLFKQSDFADVLGVPIIVYDSCAFNWGFRRSCSIPRDRTVRYATYKIIGAKCSLVLFLNPFNYGDLGPASCGWKAPTCSVRGPSSVDRSRRGRARRVQAAAGFPYLRSRRSRNYGC
jgi:hypothetical protein